MRLSSVHYFPLAWPFLLALLLIAVFVIAMIELRILRYAYERMGINTRYVMVILLLSLFGSSINIPVAHLPGEEVVTAHVVEVFGMRYVIPEVEETRGTTIAVNVGGALIPTLLSIYLLIKNALYIRGLIATAVVTVVVHMLARPVPGLGITVPTVVPPLIAAGAALLLSWQHAAPLAYIAGTLGTLLGADILNLGKIEGLHAPVASIGGAGTFDGVFMTGILAVLLAGIFAPREPATAWGRA
ncbi:MAG TPA: DUF1614 domain-containing protein [Gemmataceae bacterium]|jgi:uncharacterized membrane protein|nr:DUF1614 domain-containing protein [Gemmataceae bacterium]